MSLIEPVKPGNMAVIISSDGHPEEIGRYVLCGELYSGTTYNIYGEKGFSSDCIFVSAVWMEPHPDGDVYKRRRLLKISPSANQFTKETRKEVVA